MEFLIKMRLSIKALLITLAIPYCAFANSVVSKKDGIELEDDGFPWELVVDRGKILGCVYDSRFYSLGSILILESLPRKCEQASDRNGVWQILSEQEMSDFKQSIKEQEQAQREVTFVGGKPLTDEEARLIRFLRHSKRMSAKKSK